jgi:hypothetical protein
MCGYQTIKLKQIYLVASYMLSNSLQTMTIHSMDPILESLNFIQRKEAYGMEVRRRLQKLLGSGHQS